MIEKELIFILVCAAVAIVGTFNTAFQLYKIVWLDATTRGLKHPRFWGVFALNSNNSSGLLLYLINRRKYPVINITQENREEIKSRKKKVGVGLVFLAVGSIGMFIFISLM